MHSHPSRRHVVAGGPGAVAATASEDNTASHSWLIETHRPTASVDPSAEACDSYHGYTDHPDIAAGQAFEWFADAYGAPQT